MTVWVVQYGNAEPGHIAAIYDNEEAAREHIALHDELFVDGQSGDMLRLEVWAVRSASGVQGVPS